MGGLFSPSPSLLNDTADEDLVAGEAQRRGAVADPAGRGWEYVLGLDFPGNAERWGDFACARESPIT